MNDTSEGTMVETEKVKRNRFLLSFFLKFEIDDLAHEFKRYKVENKIEIAFR